MTGQRQAASKDLVNRRGGRGRGMVVPAKRRRPPALPHEVAKPNAVRLTVDVLWAFADTYVGRDLVVEGFSEREIERMLREDAAARLAAIGERAQRLARKQWRDFFESDAGQAALAHPEYAEELRWWIVRVFERALFEPIVQAMPMVTGANRTAVRNGLARHVGDCSADIARAAEKFGMTTKDGFRLAFEEEAGADGDDMDEAMR